MKYNVENIRKLLKKFIQETNTSIYRIEKDSGVHNVTINRFLEDVDYDPRESTCNKLLTYLGYVGYIEKS